MGTLKNSVFAAIRCRGHHRRLWCLWLRVIGDSAYFSGDLHSPFRGRPLAWPLVLD